MAVDWTSLEKFTGFSLSSLNDYDLALLNLCCATGLPGADDLDIGACLDRLDQWVEEVQHETQRQWYRFLREPHDYENSPAYFQVLVMITVLQRDLGVAG